MRGSSHHPPTIRVEYDSLAEIAGRFARESEAIRATRLELSFRNDALRAGDWIGRGARAFYAEMELDILPAITRLADALDNAERATLQIRARMQIAERDAAIVLAGRPGGPDLDGMRVLASSMPDLRATAVIGGLTQILPVQVDASRPFPPAYAPAWMEPARLLVSLLPSLDGGDRSMFFLLLGQTPLGAELMARDPGLAAKLDIRVLPDQGLRQLGLIHGREGISFPARDGHYLIGVSQMDLRKAEDVGVLAHEVMHAYQREHASDPSRVSDFTQMAMEREAYLFQVGVELALALPNANKPPSS